MMPCPDLKVNFRQRFKPHWFFLGIAAMMLSACQQSGVETKPSASILEAAGASSASVTDADEFLVVDCLLPPKIKRLGSRLTFLGTRRPIKTSGVDCGIRGGEYVAYDRADYGTALAAWKESAETGDPVAQTYVGQIYERGLTGAADYQQAAYWYRAAADQGHDAALINLGQLYEQGLGVEKDQIQALNYYRMASDLDDIDMAYLVTSDVASELSTLREQVVVKTEAADELRAKMTSLERELAELVETKQAAVGGPFIPVEELQEQQADLDRQRAELAADRAELAQSREAIDGERRLLEETKQRIVEERQAVSEAEARISGLLDREAALQQRELELRTREQELKRQVDLLDTRERDLKRDERASVTSPTSEQEQTQQANAAASVDRSSSPVSAAAGASGSVIAGGVENLDQRISAIKEQLAEYGAQLREMADEDFSLPGPDIDIMSSLPLTPESRLTGTVHAPAELVSLKLNDRLLEFDTRDESGLYDFDTALPKTRGLTAITLSARDKQGKIGEASVQVAEDEDLADAGDLIDNQQRAIGSGLEQDIEFGSFHALIIGNSGFEALPDLPTVQTDTKAVANVLEGRYGFSVTRLENASRYDILSAMNAYRAEMTDSDNLFIYYAGHCQVDDATNRGYWLATDSTLDDPGSWIANAQISDMLDAIQAKRILVVADSCYSGTLSMTSVAQLDRSTSEKERRAWLETMVAKRSRTALTSGLPAPISQQGAGSRHSPFAEALVAALQDNEDIIDGSDLHTAMSARFAQGVNGRATSKAGLTPRYAPIRFTGHEAGDFFFVPLPRS